MAARKSGLGKGLDSLIPNKLEEAKEEPAAGSGSSRGSKSGKTVSTAGKSAKKQPAGSSSAARRASSAAGGAFGAPADGKADAHSAYDDIDAPVRIVPIGKVEPNREQPRRQFDEDALKELAGSIRTHGVLQPLLVADREDYYEIIAGERRWRAAKLAGLKELPVIVKQLSEAEIVEISLIENIQREDLNPIEEARAYERLLTEFALKQEEIAQRVSKSRSAITNSLRLLHLHPAVQEMLIRSELSAGHARALLGLKDPETQLELAQRIVMDHLSVRETEKRVKAAAAKGKTRREPERNAVLDAIYRDIAEDMRRILGTKVEIHPKKDKGRIEIEYYSQDELNRILELFHTIEG